MDILVATVIGTAAVAAVLYPVVRADRSRPSASGSGARRVAPASLGASGPATGGSNPEGDVSAEAALEAEVAYYRSAVRAHTACRRCGLANPPGSRFCAECGRSLGAGR